MEGDLEDAVTESPQVPDQIEDDSRGVILRQAVNFDQPLRDRRPVLELLSRGDGAPPVLLDRHASGPVPVGDHLIHQLHFGVEDDLINTFDIAQLRHVPEAAVGHPGELHQRLPQAAVVGGDLVTLLLGRLQFLPQELDLLLLVHVLYLSYRER